MTAGLCPFCGAHADSREHILPRWLLSRRPRLAPFTVEINGVPLMNRDGKLVTSEHLPRVMLQPGERLSAHGRWPWDAPKPED
jgi:hypothetical protein